MCKLDIRDFEFELFKNLVDQLNLILNSYNVKEFFVIYEAIQNGEWFRFLGFGHGDEHKQKASFILYLVENGNGYDLVFCRDGRFNSNTNFYTLFTESIKEKGKRVDAKSKIHSAFCKFHKNSKQVVVLNNLDYFMEPIKDERHLKFRNQQKCPTFLSWSLSLI